MRSTVLDSLSRLFAGMICVAALTGISAAANAQEMSADEFAETYFTMLLAGEDQAILDAFHVEPAINTPNMGGAQGDRLVSHLLEQEREFLQSSGAAPESIEHVKTTANGERVVYEFYMDVASSPNPRELFAVVVDRSEGNRPDAVRVYYHQQMISGEMQFVRQSMLPENPALLSQIARPVLNYVASIDNSNPDTWRLFTSDGVFSGPNGSVTNLRRFYTIETFGRGGIPLKLATATCDETSCALEENLASWGDSIWDVNSAGLAVYDYDDETGLLSWARVYDDLPPVYFAQPGWMLANWDALTAGFAAAGCPMDYTPVADDPPGKLLGIAFNTPCGDAGAGERIGADLGG